MISPHGQLRVYVSTRPVDFRKGIDGLALAVQEVIGLDPFCGAAFVFRAKRADRLKIVIWDGTGMVLVHKRLESGKFVWPQVQDGVMRMSPAQFSALFEGIDWRLVRREATRRPQLAGRPAAK
jgi:transposase